jgi:glycosyltransferase involved in cell wall biosynthesis
VATQRQSQERPESLYSIPISLLTNPVSNMRFPKISIVTPSFNSQRLIADTINSVLGQNYPNLEYIMIDGGSTDGTAHIIEQFSGKLSYWHSQKDGGQYDAINQGFAKSTGEIMCWLNSDDMLLPGSLFVVAEVFEQLQAVQWLSSLQPASWDASGHLAEVRTLPGFSKQAFLDGLYLPTTTKKGYWMQQESTFWRRSLWEKAGSSIPNYHLAGDFALWCQFYEHAELYGLTYPLGGFRMIEGQRSEDHQAYMNEALTALDKARKTLGWNPKLTNSLVYGALATTPFAKDYLKQSFGYQGIYLTNKIQKLPNQSEWTAVEKQFLP